MVPNSINTFQQSLSSTQVMNYSNETKTLHKDTVVGFLEPIQLENNSEPTNPLLCGKSHIPLDHMLCKEREPGLPTKPNMRSCETGICAKMP